MMTEFHALRLSASINEQVLRLASRYHVDLNSVDRLTPYYIVIGFARAGLTIDLKQREATTKNPAGVTGVCFVCGEVVEEFHIDGAVL